MHREEFVLETRGETQVIDVTDLVRRALSGSGVSEGIANVFVPGSTAGVTTIEYESGCVRDLQEALERMAPRQGHYHHNERWGDGNGFSHVRAALLGPSLSLPVADGRPLLGTWQQVVVVDCDNHARDRRLVVTVLGA